MTDDQDKPVHLVEDVETGDRFLVYGTDKGLRLDIRYEGETLWMTQAQIGQLFGRDISTISRHIANVLDEGELDERTSLQKMQTTGGRPAVLYSLDMVISVGYRVSSAQATVFRRWATGVLVQFAKKGFVVDSPRLKQPENVDRIAELRNIIRDIQRISIANYARFAPCARTMTARLKRPAFRDHSLSCRLRGGEYGLADLAQRQHSKNECKRRKKLPSRH